MSVCGRGAASRPAGRAPLTRARAPQSLGPIITDDLASAVALSRTQRRGGGGMDAAAVAEAGQQEAPLAMAKEAVCGNVMWCDM